MSTKPVGEAPVKTHTIQAVVFDMDGLIFNSEDLYDIAGDRLLQRHGKRFTREIKLQMMGKKAAQAIGILCQLAELPGTPEEVQAELQEYFLESIAASLQTLPGFHELLDRLESAGLPRAIATSSPRPLADAMLAQYDLPRRFEFVLTGDDVEHGKPHPEMYLTAAARLGVEPRTILVLEDSLAGTQAAVAAGAITVAVPNEHTRDCDFSHVQLVAESLADPRIGHLAWGAE